MMSSLKWLGVWGMVGHELPTKEDISKWSQSLKYVLEDPKGQRNFEAFLSKSNLGHHIPTLHGCLKKNPGDRKKDLEKLAAPYDAFITKLKEEVHNH